jgi:hypothetical protein
MTYQDRLLVELPGTVNDGWQVKVSGGKFALTRIEEASAGRVRLRLERAPGTSPDGGFELGVGTGGTGRRTFEVVLKPIPAC